MARKITSPRDLKALRDKTRAQMELREGPKAVQITVHMGTCGIAAGAREVFERVSDELSRSDVTNVTLQRSGCLGLCDQEPMLTLADASGKKFVYGKLDQRKIGEIVREHVLGGSPVVQHLVRT